jgi:hypothetical protein
MTTVEEFVEPLQMKIERLLIDLMRPWFSATLFVAGCARQEFPVFTPVAVETNSMETHRPSAAAPAASNTPPDARQVIRDWIPVERLDFELESPDKKWIPDLSRLDLKATEGSFTTEDILSGAGGSASVPLDSKWILKGSNSPHLRMKIRKNAVSGEFEPVGGEVELPSGVGLSYEEDSQTGEQKTFLRLKKEF